MEGMTSAALAYLGAGLGAGLALIGVGLGIGRLAASALDGMARQPQAAGTIQTRVTRTPPLRREGGVPPPP